MAYYKARTDYTKVSDGGLVGPSRAVYQGITNNAATFPMLPITMVAFLALIADYDDKLGKSMPGGEDRTTLKNNARTALVKALGMLATYVNLVALGDKAIIDLSGFDSYSTERSPSGDVTFIPTNVHWQDGIVSGDAVLRWQGDGKGSTYEVQSCTGDPTIEANWTYRGSFTGGRAELSGFTPGTIIWGRVRKIGTGGEVGGWGDPAQKRVM